jgi:chorismate--pyruvate lyase
MAGGRTMSWKTVAPMRGDLKQWLCAQGSLSAHLAATGERFNVQVLNQGRRPLSRDESLAMGLGEQRVGYGREVLLRVDGQPMVFARSVTAQTGALGAWRSVRGLGSRPLADVLFRRLGIRRGPLEFARMVRQSAQQRHVAKAWLAATGNAAPSAAMPARRSVFRRHRAALLVMEVFVADAARWRSLPGKLP